MMKILITYFSGMGNTEKVANAIWEGIDGHAVDLLPVKKSDPLSLNSYDLIFLGSGIYGFNISRKLTNLIKKAPKLPSKLAYFYTHESINPWPDAFNSIKKYVELNKSEILGVFDCRGENLKMTEDQREQLMKDFSAEKRKEWEKGYEEVKGRPNTQDLNKAREFAKFIIQKV